MTSRIRTKEAKKLHSAIFLRPPPYKGPWPGENITPDGGVCKVIIEEGSGERPKPGAFVKVHYESYTMWMNDRFDSSVHFELPLTFRLGRVPPEALRAWELAIPTMRTGEIASICCRADYAYGLDGKPPDVPPDATVRFEMELLEWEERRTKEDMNGEECFNTATALKEEGTALYKQQRFADAVNKYVEAAAFLTDLEDPVNAPSLRAVCLVNAAQCHIKCKLFERVVLCCDQALQSDPQSAKARYRRGIALTELQRFADAKADLKAACRLEPKSREFREQLEKTTAAHAAFKEANAAAYGALFSKPGVSLDVEAEAEEAEWRKERMLDWELPAERKRREKFEARVVAGITKGQAAWRGKRARAAMALAEEIIEKAMTDAAAQAAKRESGEGEEGGEGGFLSKLLTYLPGGEGSFLSKLLAYLPSFTRRA